MVFKLEKKNCRLRGDKTRKSLLSTTSMNAYWALKSQWDSHPIFNKGAWYVAEEEVLYADYKAQIGWIQPVENTEERNNISWATLEYLRELFANVFQKWDLQTARTNPSTYSSSSIEKISKYALEAARYTPAAWDSQRTQLNQSANLYMGRMFAHALQKEGDRSDLPTTFVTKLIFFLLRGEEENARRSVST